MLWLAFVVVALQFHNFLGRPQFDFGDYDYSDQFQNPNQFTEVAPFATNEPTERPGRPMFTFVRPPGAGIAAGATTTVAPQAFFACLQGCVVTSQYNPVCGSDRETYNNMSRLRCAQSCGKRSSDVSAHAAETRGPRYRWALDVDGFSTFKPADTATGVLGDGHSVIRRGGVITVISA